MKYLVKILAVMLVLPFFLANAARAESTIDAVMERGVLQSVQMRKKC